MKRSRYRLYIQLMALSGIVLTATLVLTSAKIIQGGKKFNRMILKENKAFVINTLRAGHGMMARNGVQTYENLIDLALKSKFISYLALLDESGSVIARSDSPDSTPLPNQFNPADLKDGGILKETERVLFIFYRAKSEVAINKEHKVHHASLGESMPDLTEPGWFLVGMDISNFQRHYRDMVTQTVGVGTAILLLGILIIIFLGIIQRYELAHLSIEKLNKIKGLLGHFVPKTARDIIDKEAGKKGILNKYMQDATILFLDIEGSSLLQRQYPQERINRTIESYFSYFLGLIQQNGGDINETAGDGMMVIYLHADGIQHARNAARTATDIREYTRSMPEKGDPDLFPICVNIGIQSGDVYLGTTKMRGSEGDRWTFTASGPPTIIAARLAQYAREGQIMVGSETARRIETFFPLNCIGEVPLKNVMDPGKTYEIIP